MEIVKKPIMKGFSYIVARDFGFAPNPFGQFCTLATCKPIIRKQAQIGDIIFGLTAKKFHNNLIYAMVVNEKLTFNQYWDDARFQYKKPVMNGSLKQLYGDNIYYYNNETSQWNQADSHHSLDDGKVNIDNLNRDTSSDAVLISSDFYYFGKSPIDIPSDLKSTVIVGRAFKKLNEEEADRILTWLKSNYEYGLVDEPKQFLRFERYNGIS